MNYNYRNMKIHQVKIKIGLSVNFSDTVETQVYSGVGIVTDNTIKRPLLEETNWRCNNWWCKNW